MTSLRVEWEQAALTHSGLLHAHGRHREQRGCDAPGHGDARARAGLVGRPVLRLLTRGRPGSLDACGNQRCGRTDSQDFFARAERTGMDQMAEITAGQMATDGGPLRTK